MKFVKRSLAMLLVAAMLLSFAACGAPKAQQGQTEQLEEAPQKDQMTDLQDMDRQDKELIAELVGGNQEANELTDQELDQLIDQLVGEVDDEAASGVVNLSGNKEQPSVEVTPNPDAYDQNGAITKPFDQVYPELIEKEQVAFSGESILVKMRSDSLTDGLKAAGVGALEKIVPMEGCAWYEAKLTEGTDSQKALEAVRQLSEVMLAEFNYEVQTAALDDYKHFDKEKDEDFKKNGHNKDQWHFHYCGIPDGYQEMETEGGDKGVIVAVIDSGVDYAHEDLKDNMWVNTKETPDNGIDDDGNGYVDDYYGVDIIDKKGNGDDTNGHGTHVAGIIAARNNNVGVMGIAYNVKIMSVKAAAHNGTLNQADIAKAVLYAYENGAEVINMSFGGSASSIAVQDALQTAYTRCVLVASAGNNGENNEPTAADPIYLPNYPAALTYVLGVMSVDENGVESIFTNYDTKAFNNVEYELYAPGENIMSTLPGNKYGYLSGTSMAAPVVSAFAAILRSEFGDRDMYPTKFIYGQLTCTSGIQADCLSVAAHGKHNVPQVVDLNAALTKLPKPEVNLQDWAIFDDPKYSANNNGDGVIDAGETIALGLTVRNRWGMSKNTQVTIDTLSTAGLSDPYLTIKTGTVDFGSVGTYSTQDNGKIYTDELLTGWENPFLIEVSKDCPNDYRFSLNVTITCENALDEADSTVYTTQGKVSDAVRSGYVLPSIIEEDMVLTKDNLYIIPNATIIQTGVTVRVEPGTHIQFWSNDPKDPYASSYIAYLLVKGNFLVEGTKEEPVYIYPSRLMDKYCVEFGADSNGYISLKYADITNFAVIDSTSGNHTGTNNKVNLADHCIFRQNYTDYMYYRYLSGGNVSSAYSRYKLGNVNARDCVYYKIASYSDISHFSTAQRCIFVECGINYNGVYQDCVFLKNNFVKENGGVRSSSYATYTTPFIPKAEDVRIFYRAEAGTTYVSVEESSINTKLLKEIGGAYFVPETEDEYQWVVDNLFKKISSAYNSTYYNFRVGITYDYALEQFTWSDGSLIFDLADPQGIRYSAARNSTMYLDSKGQPKVVQSTMSGYGYYVYEIPGYILPEEITLDSYAQRMDTEMTYQINPINKPIQLPVDAFIYESTDESVLTVSETGLVTPISTGKADVYVYSHDRAVWNYISFEIADYIPITGLSFAQDSVLYAVGETVTPKIQFVPADTTRRQVTYCSDNSAVVAINSNGVPVAVGKGIATLTVQCEQFTDTVTVQVYVPATSIDIDVDLMSVALSDGSCTLPSVTASGADAQVDIAWSVSDSNVAQVEADQLILKAEGVVELIATDVRTGVSDGIPVYVNGEKTVKVERVLYSNDSYTAYILLSDGRLLHYGDELFMEDVVDVDICGRRGIAVQNDGTVYTWNDESGEVTSRNISEYGTFVSVSIYGGNMFAVNTDGELYAWGANINDSLGLGHSDRVEDPTYVYADIYGGIKMVEAGDGCLLALTDDNGVYCLIYSEEDARSYWQYAGSDVVWLSRNETCFATDYYVGVADSYGVYHQSVDLSEYDMVALSESRMQIAVKDGCVYWNDGWDYWNDGDIIPIFRGLENVVDVFCVGSDTEKDGEISSTAYAVTQDGYIYAMGSARDYMFGTYFAYLGIQRPVQISGEGTSGLRELKCVAATGVTETALTDSKFTMSFNKPVVGGELYVNDQTESRYLTKQVSFENNRVVVQIPDGLQEGHAYRVSLSVYGIDGTTYSLSIAFTYEQQSATQIPGDTGSAESGEIEVVHESQLDASIVRVVTPSLLVERLNTVQKQLQYQPYFYGNVILNHVSTDTNVSHWLRPLATTVTAGTYKEIPFGGNYWGSTNKTTIELQMTDYSDFITYARLMYAPYLTEAPENTFPFVTSVKLINKYGEEVTTVGNEEITFQVKFNRDMDTSIPLQVRFGSAVPYGDYQIDGQYVDARTWEGVYTLKTVIENGDQYFSISNGCSATEDLTLQPDAGRFRFAIDTTAAQALIMQGTATDTGIELRWTQDDFKTLMGYNVYRSTKEDGQYTRLNSTVIPANTMTWFDDTVEPGVVYYYNFTVVQTDLTESEPSGKIAIMSKDTMAPNIYHSPVTEAFTGSNLVLSATITDNLNIAYANLYYRIVGTDTWSIIRMNKLNDKFSAIIPASYITVAGVEYYIEAFDGVSYTYKASAEAPYTIAVQEALDADSLGDVDGDGVITNLDALLLLYTINDKYNMTAEEFARADLNGDGELMAAEALRILQYVSGVVGSVKM